MFAFSLTPVTRLIAIALAVAAVIALTLVLVDPALAGNYGYYYRP